MKTSLLLFSFVVLFIAPASAQFSLTQTSYPTAPVGNDSVSLLYGTTGLPTNMGAGASLFWDFSGINYIYTDTPWAYHYSYTGFTYQEFAVHSIHQPSLFYDARSLCNITGSGITKFGEHLDGKGFSLATAPGASLTDSIIFPTQTDTFSVPFTKIPFPATFSTHWSSSVKTDAKFTISYSIFYNHAPGIYRSYLSERDTAIGYGKVFVKDANGKVSDSISVLEVKVNYHQSDSFFINSTPAPAALLDSFGLAQGQVTNSFEYRYYRANEVTPLVDVYFPDSTYNKQSVTRTFVHTQRIPLPSAVPVLTAQNNIEVYPNPVTNKTFTVRTSAAMRGAVSYKIVNVAGKVVAGNSVPAGQTNIEIALPATTVAGTYFLQVYNNGTQVAVRSLAVN